MNSAAEAQFRVQTPNSRPASIKIIALNIGGEAVVRRLAAVAWQHATFFTAVLPDEALRDLGGDSRSITEEVGTADLVVFVAAPGGRAHAAAAIGRACSLDRVMTTGLVVGAASAPEGELSKTLAQLRPWSLMVVIAKNDEYIDDMITALRA